MKRVMVMVAVASWSGMAVAAPAKVVVPHVKLLKLPVDGAQVVAELKSGELVCVVHETTYQGTLHRRPGWLAIHVAGGVGYASTVAVELVADAQETALCSSPQPADGAASSSEPRAAAAVGPVDATGSVGAAGLVDTAAASSPAGAFVPIEASGTFMPRAPARVSLGMGTGAAWIRKNAAEEHHIGDSGVTFNLSLGLTIADVFAISATGGASFPSDSASFNQSVVPENGPGAPHSAESSLEVQSYSIAAGLRTPFLVLAPRGANGTRGLAGALFADYGWSKILGNRSISNCVDCRDDDLSMESGSFWRFGLDVVSTSPKVSLLGGLNASYQRYLGGAGLVSEVRVGFMFWL